MHGAGVPGQFTEYVCPSLQVSNVALHMKPLSKAALPPPQDIRHVTPLPAAGVTLPEHPRNMQRPNTADFVMNIGVLPSGAPIRPDDTLSGPGRANPSRKTMALPTARVNGHPRPERVHVIGRFLQSR